MEKSLRARMKEMKPGENITVPVTAIGYTTVRSYASDMSFAMGRSYSTHRDRATRTYTITRNS